MTIKQLEAVLAWAFDEELPRGSLAERIEAAGGIGPILSGEARPPEAALARDFGRGVSRDWSHRLRRAAVLRLRHRPRTCATGRRGWRLSESPA